MIDQQRDTYLSLSRRALLAGAALSLTSLAAFAAVPRRSEHRLAQQKLGLLIPGQIGPWRFTTHAGVVDASIDGPVDGYDQVVSRTYEAEGRPSIMLLLAFGSTQGGSLQLHRPETCYPGQGFKLSAFSDTMLYPQPGAAIPAKRFTAIRDDRTERLVYWTRIGRSFPRSTAQEYESIIASVMRGVIPDGILVRISIIGDDIAASDEAISAFASALLARDDAGRKILIGDAMAAMVARKAAGREV